MCCSTACDGACERCDDSGNLGECVPLVAGTVDMMGCPTDGEDPLCGRDGTCTAAGECQLRLPPQADCGCAVMNGQASLNTCNSDRECAVNAACPGGAACGTGNSCVCPADRPEIVDGVCAACADNDDCSNGRTMQQTTNAFVPWVATSTATNAWRVRMVQPPQTSTPRRVRVETALSSQAARVFAKLVITSTALAIASTVLRIRTRPQPMPRRVSVRGT